ncbi:MAG TPA: prepilin peptidase [Phycisphaerales bacterium]|nr:prepilin peptidase [Phycisphaerales bacterium]
MSDLRMHVYSAMAIWLPVVWIFAVGACIGSLVNVLVYRLPKGLPVIVPSSRCPKCNTKLTFRENIPIFGWLFLRGRCRFCRESISPEYPLVETLVAVLFAGLYILWYVVPPGTVALGIDWGSIKPDWAKNGVRETWPAFTVLLVLVGSLVAMTLIDFKTFTIPLVLTWVPVGVALVLHPLNALLVGQDDLRYTAGRLGDWIIATPGPAGWWWVGACFGAVIGLGVANLLLATGRIGRSFADYEAWEAQALAEAKASTPAEDLADLAEADTPEMWVQYPHARREMVRELAFLAPVAALGWAGAWGAVEAFGWADVPLWLQALTGVLMGYLIGGGLVWGVRIFGSLAFGKEAMGLGDVHVLAAVGACLGWPDAILTFFAAVVVGLFFAIFGLIFSFKAARMMAFGPCLAIGALLVILCKPLIEAGLGSLMSWSVPLNLP